MLTQDLGTGTCLTRPCRCSPQMTQGTRPDSSGSCTRSMQSTGCDLGRTRICSTGRQPTTTSSGHTFGTIPESLATRANTPSIPQQRPLRTLPGSRILLSIFPRIFSRIVLRTPEQSSKSVRYPPIHSPSSLANQLRSQQSQLPRIPSLSPSSSPTHSSTHSWQTLCRRCSSVDLFRVTALRHTPPTAL